MAVEDGAEGEAVAEGGGHVGDADIAVALALLLAPQLQVLDGRHGLDGTPEMAAGPHRAPGAAGSPSLALPCPAGGCRRVAAGRAGEEAGKGAGEGRAAAPVPRGLPPPRLGAELWRRRGGRADRKRLWPRRDRPPRVGSCCPGASCVAGGRPRLHRERGAAAPPGSAGGSPGVATPRANAVGTKEVSFAPTLAKGRPRRGGVRRRRGMKHGRPEASRR